MKHMLAKSLMALGFISIQTSATAGSWNKSVYQEQIPSYSTPALIYNLYRNIFSRLNEEDRRKHRQAVHFALNNLDNGEDIVWYSDDGYRSGTVEVVQTTMKNGDVCRRLFSTVSIRSDQRTFEEWACYKNSTNTWNFSDK